MTVSQQSARDEAAKFVAEFGQHGGVWYAEGKSFEECGRLRLAELTSENESLKTKVGQLGTNVAELRKKLAKLQSEDTPVSFDSANDKTQRTGTGSKIRFKSEGKNEN